MARSLVGPGVTGRVDLISRAGSIIDISRDTLIISRLTVSTRLSGVAGSILHDVALVDSLVVITLCKQSELVQS